MARSADGPSHSVRGLLHRSNELPDVVDCVGVVVKVIVASNGSIVGEGTSVSVGAGVALGSSVGVFVGNASSV